MKKRIIFFMVLLVFTTYTKEFIRLENTFELIECIRTGYDRCIANPEGKPVKIKDISTGEEKNYVTDGKKIYYTNENNDSSYHKKYYSVFEGADAKTFSVIGSSFVKDKDNVYYITRRNNTALKSADPKTFEYIGESYPFVYAKDKKNVYAVEKFGDPVYLIANADPATFELLSDNYSKDKNHIYFQEKPAKGIDVKTFEILDYFHVKDKNNIYIRSYNGYKPVKGADLKSFELVTTRYTKDKNNVYYDGEIIIGADSPTFRILKNISKNEERYAADKKNVYIDGKIIQEADPLTFELISPNFAKDKNNVYYKNNRTVGKIFISGLCIREDSPGVSSNGIKPVNEPVSFSRELPVYELQEIKKPVFTNLSGKAEASACTADRESWTKLENADPDTFEINYEIKLTIPMPHTSSGIPVIEKTYLSKDGKNYYIDFYRVDGKKWKEVRDKYIMYLKQ